MAGDGSLISIPGGIYRLGSVSIREAEAGNLPHEVELSPYRLGKYQVTNAEYRAFIESTGRPPPPSWSETRFSLVDAPVVGVSWDEAAAY